MDQRSVFKRDRDRILYTSALRRLAGVTQVVAASEGHIFHNRLTHTVEVAQIARRLAEFLAVEQEDLAELYGLDPEVAEAAALAHDLGHPPFGHVAEEALDSAVKASGVMDGFEGNPQSFRVVTKLAKRHEDFEGLNLSRAVLNAILKYPWYRQTDGSWKERKWGAYHTEEEDFAFARAEHGSDGEKSAEAEIMDWADDIAYAVHDVEDFYRAGLIPLDRILKHDDDVERFMSRVFNRWRRNVAVWDYSEGELTRAFLRVIDLIRRPPISMPYEGTLEQRAVLRSTTSELIGRYIRGLRLREQDVTNQRRVERDRELDMELRMLKQLTWEYVVLNPSLGAQQHGEQRVVGELYDMFLDAACGGGGILPVSARERLEAINVDVPAHQRETQYVRLAVDLVAGMTEEQAMRVHARLTGRQLGSVVDLFIR
jgi:dGTPase